MLLLLHIYNLNTEIIWYHSYEILIWYNITVSVQNEKQNKQPMKCKKTWERATPRVQTFVNSVNNIVQQNVSATSAWAITKTFIRAHCSNNKSLPS